MVTLKQTLLRTREWSIFRIEDVKPVADKNAIYKEFEEWIEFAKSEYASLEINYSDDTFEMAKK